MPKRAIVLCFTVVLISNTVGAIKANCNKEEGLQRCSMALPVLSSPEISFALTREELDKSCVELRVGIKCIDNYTEVCMEKSEQVMFRRIYAGITDVVQELCTRGKYQDEYLRHATCVKKVRPEYEVCSKNYEGTLSMISDHQKKDQYHTDSNNVAASQEDYLRTVCWCWSGDVATESPVLADPRLDRQHQTTWDLDTGDARSIHVEDCKRPMSNICRSFREYLLCSEQTVLRSCGDEAALFTSAFLKRMASNIIKNFCFEYRGKECSLAGKATTMDHSSLLIPTILATLYPYLYGNFVPT